MLINEIPNDCLLAIFDYMVDLADLISCYKVCVKWSHLIAKRTKKVKYLLDQRGYSSDAVYYPRPCLFDATYLSKLFTNLTIADLSIKLNFEVENVIQFVTKQKCLKGLINPLDEPIEKYCDNLEMLSVDDFNPNNLRNGSSIKQLEIFSYRLEHLKRDVHLFPNLERLKIKIIVPDNPYDGPVLEKLKILEMAFRRPCNNIFYGFQLMDFCPNLQSAHILMCADTWVFDETLKHNSLQDLVLQFYGYENDNWNNLKRLFMKYPNLKHLSLRCRQVITDSHIEQLVRILPNLVLLDVSECQEVTQRAADYVKDYCKGYGRSIKFYYNGNHTEIKSYRPQLFSERELLTRGFDFMKNCFFRDHIHLSLFLIPIDY
ncbi:uncharacterized protein LOC107369756 [Tetranychus urticae]|uniref:F-box domain-containing protein n=1 Tax=Tetranychus urticae TaxID=32264 RepID=T1L2S3_TETUR|nr:uncharacterized protein LOC107369756 [Tetranychus urticae]